jgi:hypothetical protein
VQSNYGLLVSPEASELAELPEQSATTNSEQMVKLTLDAIGNLQATVKGVRVGDRAVVRMEGLRTVTTPSPRVSEPLRGRF